MTKNDQPFDEGIWNVFVLMQMVGSLSKACVDSPEVTFEDYFKQLDPAIDGMILEFGVAGGESITRIANALKDRKVYGFDSFNGLPEEWEYHPRGLFVRDGPPGVPPNVELVVGLFQDTLRPFLECHPGPVSFVHIDCDLYVSTKFVLDQLKDRIVEGTIIAFDEVFYLAKNLKHEMRAFGEFLMEYGYATQCIGHWGYDKAAFRMIPPPYWDVEVGSGVAPK